jgi:hypothetical protein
MNITKRYCSSKQFSTISTIISGLQNEVELLVSDPSTISTGFNISSGYTYAAFALLSSDEWQGYVLIIVFPLQSSSF